MTKKENWDLKYDPPHHSPTGKTKEDMEFCTKLAKTWHGSVDEDCDMFYPGLNGYRS